MQKRNVFQVIEEFVFLHIGLVAHAAQAYAAVSQLALQQAYISLAWFS